MRRNRGKRYDNSPKLNYKKILGVVVAIAVILMIIFSIIKIINSNNNKTIEENVEYFALYHYEKWGVINSNGNIVIEPIYNEMIVIPNKTKPIFICTYILDDATTEYKTKVINEKSEEILFGYDKIEAIDNYDSKKNIWYEDNVLRVVKNGKYGLINFEGEELLPCEYNSIYTLKGVTNSIIIEKDGKVGLVNEKGQVIIKTEYKQIQSMKEDYKSEYIIVTEADKYGVISTSGTIIIEPKYEEIKYVSSSEVFAVRENGTWKLSNINGEIIIDGGYDNITFAKGENIIVMKNSKYGIINKEKEEKVAIEYDELKHVFSIYYIAKKDGKYGIIDIDNKQVVAFEYINMYYVENGGFIIADKEENETIVFDNNLAEKLTGIVSEINIQNGYIKIYSQDEYKYYNFKFEEKKNSDILTSNTLFLSKKDGKYGYKNATGIVVVDYIYDDATEQNSYGYAAVKQDGKWGCINKGGAIVLEPTIDLDNSIYINFIGKWHLSDDGLYYSK